MMPGLADLLIAEEIRGKKPPDASRAVSIIIEKLRPDLQILMGNMGFRALLSRAIAQASAEYAWLSALHVKSDGSLDGLSQLELEAHVNSGMIADGRAALLAQLLGSLTSFIGESVTLRLVRNIWPNTPLDDLDSGKGMDK